MTTVSTKPQILVVEDQPEILDILKLLLTGAGCDVTDVQTGAEGIKAALEKEFDLISLDIGLPDISGFEVCQRLKQDFRAKHTPVIFISGDSSEKNWRRGLELGAADYIEKPLNGSAFVRRILSHIKPAKRME